MRRAISRFWARYWRRLRTRKPPHKKVPSSRVSLSSIMASRTSSEPSFWKMSNAKAR
jgi:hypothetical protein